MFTYIPFFSVEMSARHAEVNVHVNLNMENQGDPANLANPANLENPANLVDPRNQRNPTTPNVHMENAKDAKLSSVKTEQLFQSNLEHYIIM